MKTSTVFSRRWTLIDAAVCQPFTEPVVRLPPLIWTGDFDPGRETLILKSAAHTVPGDRQVLPELLSTDHTSMSWYRSNWRSVEMSGSSPWDSALG